MRLINLSRLITLALLAGGVLVAPALAQSERQPTDQQCAQFEARLQETRDRLGLTPEQEDVVRPILINSLEQGAGLLQRYGFDGETRPDLSWRERRSLRADLKGLREQTDLALTAVLTPEQRAEYDRIREERQGELRARYRSGR